ncbi:MAG: excinuclease ABC subunit UvrA [Candidatus Thorarchaeota archaeon]|nr:MAG: excinuclease ABC subunit UvrA [Candidatus Thorarchaeota archaeon]
MASSSKSRAKSVRLDTEGPQDIVIRGAAEHNLKHIDLQIPRNKLTVVTGVSGSGKSSLVFDTIFAEGQRRFVESLSPYARQFLGMLEKPKVDYMSGLSPSISIDQKSAGHNPRSTVGTITEIYDFLRLLFARVGVPHCPKCGKKIEPQTAQQIVDRVLALGEGTSIAIMAPIVRERKGEYRKEFRDLLEKGFVRVRVDGELKDIEEGTSLDRYYKHTIEVVIDRLKVSDSQRARISEAVETALTMADRVVTIAADSGDLTLSEKFACVDCGISLPEMEPRLFSWNTPHGACPTCTGLGVIREIDTKLVVSDDSLSISQGAIAPYNWMSKSTTIKAVANRYGFSMDTPWRDLTPDQKDKILWGTGDEEIKIDWHWGDDPAKTQWEGTTVAPFRGVIAQMERNYKSTKSNYIREWLEHFMVDHECSVCKGLRLRPESTAVKFRDLSITDVNSMSIKDLSEFFQSVVLSPREEPIAHPIIKEIMGRLGFLMEVGLDYLTLDRSAPSLAGGEAQRIRLASQIGSNLVGVTYVCDEPSIGLHQRDNLRLLRSLKSLRDIGNTVVVVEHDESTMRAADYLVDLGPGAGDEGGRVVVAGKVDDVLASKKSLTAKYLRGDEKIPVPAVRRQPNGRFIEIKGARHHNLKSIDVKIPLGLFVCVTGVSGSGKSSLIDETLQRELARRFYNATATPGECDAIIGAEQLDKVIIIDQSPIGRTPRSNPATYVSLFSDIRDLFSGLPEAKIRGYKPGRFSFNVKGGRCEKCRGAGVEVIEMQFLPPVEVTCAECKGRRYNRETLQVRYKGKNIADVLAMRTDEALDFFADLPSIHRKLKTLYEVGMGYVQLGQPATTLSGGEAQRIKLSKFLSRPATGQTLLLLDEPTTGLHFADIKKLLEVLHRLVDLGNTVLVVEHQLDVVKTADWVIDLGPEGGDEGGYLIAEGTPEQVAERENSYTGKYLRGVLHEARPEAAVQRSGTRRKKP